MKLAALKACPQIGHTPNAVRIVVEGEGAWRTVDGESCLRLCGDMILTSTGLWHEHGHDGDKPVIRLNVPDLPLVYEVRASYHVHGGARLRALIRASTVGSAATRCPRPCSNSCTRSARCCVTRGPTPGLRSNRGRRVNLTCRPCRTPLSSQGPGGKA